jgi:predicted dehydrogenase
MERLRIGIVGLGKMGLLHASILNTFPNIQLVGLCEKSNLVIRIAKKIFKEPKVINDINDFSPLKPDAIFVTTPIPSHFTICKNILESNITNNLFVEKTLTAKYAESKQLYEIAENSGGTNMVGYMKRFNVVFQKAYELLAANTLGKLEYFSAYAYSSDFASTQTVSGISANRGGVLSDLGGHIVDLALWLFGDMSVENANLKGSGSEDEVQFSIQTLNGVRGSFEVSWIKQGYRMPEFGLTIHGKNGELKVNNDKLELNAQNMPKQVWYRQNLNDAVPFLLGDPEYYSEDRHFIGALTSKTPVLSSFQSGAKVDQILTNVKKTGAAL